MQGKTCCSTNPLLRKYRCAQHIHQTQIVMLDRQYSLYKKISYMVNAERSDNIEGGTMQTKVCLSSSGQLTGITRTFTKLTMRGFTGCVRVVLFTDDGRSHIGEDHRYGVDGTWISRSDRTETWVEQVPVEFASKVRECAIVHSHDPGFDLGKAFNELKSDLGSTIASLIAG